ncbi:MAG TPA: phospholipase D-like domain-containing protein [Burkholderiales bacterium]|nr:phospholipase D-like domain-containing protein [Burkholderiales bacterium]
MILLWVLPALGVLAYILLGVNRVQRRAARLRRGTPRHRSGLSQPAGEPGTHFAPLARLVGEIVGRPLLPGNSVEPLLNGVEAYPAMLEAIGGAQRSIMLGSYLFDDDGVGAQFVEALVAAKARGVEIRVLIDDVSNRFSRHAASKPLRRAGIEVGIFNPPFLPARLHAANLRNHRKIMVVDGALGFTGGMNIASRYWREGPDQAFRDLHFRLRGPVVTHLAEVFCDDWAFAVAERLQGETWFPPLAPAGSVLARGIESGPDEAFERVRWAMIGALNAAQRSVRVLTPYFIPDGTLISCLNAAALRGVDVDIVLPEETDLPHVRWAAFGQLWQVLDHGCEVYLRPGPFDHSKLLVVDGAYVLLGSANWDARSLRLNFEFDVECYSVELGAKLDGLVEARISQSRPYTMASSNARPLPVKLRDGIARLFAPYL